MSFDLSKIRRWKIELYGEVIILVTKTGIVTRIISSVDWIDFNMLVSWNVYSIFRHLLTEYEIVCYRMKNDGSYQKVNNDKLLKIANEPLTDNVL